MATSNNQPVQNRYDIVYFFDITDGNPNGDPDAGNLPRLDPETGQGLVTDVCLKRKVRNYVGLRHSEKPPFEIYVKEKAVLNNQNERAYVAVGEKPEKRKMPKEEKKAREITAWMCANFFDIRTFGAVMSTDVNCGQVRGAVQVGFARSIDPIISAEHAVTRCAVTTQAEADKQQGDNRTMGRKFTVPYGLYRAHAYVNPGFAEQTGFSTSDLALFKEALGQMFENDKSAARANMRPCRCIVFKHESKLGNARSDQLFARVKVQLKQSLRDKNKPPRSFDDYEVKVDESDLPAGVTVEYWV
jgi:CRISPR-associated protein Csd2